jgi:ABC-type nitrate/sulfonate/bicarbonate transport system ATPase subunit
LSLQIKGNFSWGVKDRGHKDLDSCIDLKAIDLQLKKGEFVCVIGDVGCGKSSLLSAINREMLYIPSEISDQNQGESDLAAVQSQLFKYEIKDSPIKVKG